MNNNPMRGPTEASAEPTSDEFADRLLGAIGTALIVRARDGRVIVWNAGAERLLGHSALDVLGRPLADVGLGTLDAVADEVLHREEDATALTRELLLRRSDGSFAAVLADVSTLAAADGGAVFVMSDLTHRMRAEQQLRAAREQFELLLNHSADMVAVVDAEGRIAFVNTAIMAQAGYAIHDLLGQDACRFVHEDDRAAVDATLQEVVKGGSDTSPLLFRFRNRDGDYIWLEGRAVNLLHQRSVRGILVALHDVTHRISLEETLAHRATHDGLTGLPNRALFLDRLEHELERARRHSLSLAVLFWDIDGFKLINDAAGHAVGDSVLVEVGRRATAAMRAEDTVARLGGDEFVACAAVTTPAQACVLAERLLEALEIDITLPGGQHVPVTASIGVAFGVGPSAELLVREADAAMYETKHTGGNGITIHGMTVAASSVSLPATS